MKINKFHQRVYDQEDLCDLIMQGRSTWEIPNVVVDHDVDLEKITVLLEDPGQLLTWNLPENETTAVSDFHARCQDNWYMPQEYRDFDIAAYVLSLCKTPEELQRAGEELLLFQEHHLFELLKYLRYLVDVMRQNHIIWGVGRGSSVASYVLYLLGVHRINSMYYDLDPREFLR